MKHYKKYVVVCLTILYSLVFWYEKAGVNLFVFTLLIVGLLLREFPQSLSSPRVRVTLAGTIMSAIMMFVLNSNVSKFALIVSFFVMLGFIHQHSLRSIGFSIRHTLSNFLRVPVMLFKNSLVKNAPSATPSVFYYVQRAFIPVIIVFIFYCIFLIANVKFARASDYFWDHIGDFFGNIFDYISFGRLMFTLFGAFLLAGIFYRAEIVALINKEASLQDILFRERIRLRYKIKRAANALKFEYQAALILMTLVNVLLLVVNIIDINWIWFNFTVPKGFDLKHFVHEGTYLLIFSILLSIGIILYYFRRNLNFYPGNKWLKNLAYIWMCQNMVLAYSVLLRNYHYIHIHGFAYKRLGVILFLILVAVGLVTMLVKIHKLKSAFWLVRNNSWAVYAMMIFMACVNWDPLIARFNLSHWNKEGIDVDFYFTLSPKVLPLLYESLPVIESQIKASHAAGNTHTSYPDLQTFTKDLDRRRSYFLEDQSLFTWLSWNVSDQQTLTALK